MGAYEHGYDDILTQVQHRFGFTPTIFNSGGGIMILESRLEGGDFIWITDADCDVTPRPRRVAAEADGRHIGWQVSIYPPEAGAPPLDLSAADTVASTAPAVPEVDSCTRLASVTHHTAPAEQLPDLIGLALRGRRRHEHHLFDADGTYTVRLGIDHY
ncbi:hypothetical protein [Mycolicibacterium llatzerense]|uniref:hypothetical protein n=1 Tax=Mycolicibacterium llatzerense TaxID=280871 RepID=UPI0021B6C90B|nr:hypothetical protein [Mycolicibacterium llatzerense]MCT7367282.1 hypothetical protein [Mycolicibacterium llatzerense]